MNHILTFACKKKYAVIIEPNVKKAPQQDLKAKHNRIVNFIVMTKN